MGKTNIEVGKYYVDGEGFYKVLGHEESHGTRKVQMEFVTIKYQGISYFKNFPLIEEACERRMVECSKEQFEYVKKKALDTYNELWDFNDKVFRELWNS